MKTIILIIILALGLIAFLSEGFLNFLSDISSILFFGCATLSIISISAIIAIDSAKLLKYKIINNEYENLKEDLHDHITRNVYQIEFNDDAYIKHQELQNLDQKITNIKGVNYENN